MEFVYKTSDDILFNSTPDEISGEDVFLDGTR